jgi:hypothetical protein
LGATHPRPSLATDLEGNLEVDPAAPAAGAHAAARADDARPAPRPVPAALLWLGYGVALSPVLVDLALHMRESPWTRYAALFPVLFAVSAWRERHVPRAPRRDGLLWIALGFAIAAFAVFSGSVRFGRAGAVLAALGLCRRYALASGRSQLLLPFCVPVPTALARELSPELPQALLAAAAGVVGALGIDLTLGTLRVTTGAGLLALDRYDAGLSLAALCAGLAWYAGLRWQTAPLRALLATLGAAVLALPLQATAIAIALFVLAAGAPDAARSLLTHAPWLATAAVGLLAIEGWARREVAA